jgi:hypothetical protein
LDLPEVWQRLCAIRSSLQQLQTGEGDMSNSDIRKQLGGFPTGRNKLAGKEFRVIHHKAPEKEGWDLLEGFTLFMTAKAPFQELEEAVERMIRQGILK